MAEGRQYARASHTEVTAKVVTGVVLDESQIGQPLKLTLASPLRSSGARNRVYTADQCFFLARFEGFKDSMPSLGVISASCIDDTGVAYEKYAAPGQTLGSAYWGTGSIKLRLGSDNGSKTIDPGTNITLHLTDI